MGAGEYRVHLEDARGRILVANTLASFESDDHRRDVVLGCSFGGLPICMIPLRQGARGWIAHEGGPGKDEAGIEGLPIADRWGVPAAAISTMSARIAHGEDLLTGVVSRINDAAARCGIAVGMAGEAAALAMLDAPPGHYHDITGLMDEKTVLLKQTDHGGIYACWSASRVSGRHPDDVFVLASHGARTMAKYVVALEPKGVICNDAGMALDESGIEGLSILDAHNIPAAAVAADSARIGDPTSTYGGVISAVNAAASAKGVVVGQPASLAADLLLT